MNIAGLLTGGLLGAIKDIIGQLKLSPEKRAELEILLEQNQHIIRLKELELEAAVTDRTTEEIKEASANIRAEATSVDPYVARSRPTFLYIIYAVLVFNFIALPIGQVVAGNSIVPIALPSDLYWLFGAGYLGYAGFRSLDKSGFRWNR